MVPTITDQVEQRRGSNYFTITRSGGDEAKHMSSECQTTTARIIVFKGKQLL